jgi:hypothetical protein
MSGITEAILGGIGNLDKRPNALSSAIDTYQGAPRADYSQANNSTKIAKKITSISKLLESVGSDTFENYQKIEERSAFDTYILSSPEEQKEYKKAVKEHRLAPSQSPFYRRKLELLIAKDSVMGYQQQYAVDYQLAIQGNPNLNLTEWNRNHYSNHVKEHGLNTLSTEAQAAFGKGIESIYISTLAQNMKAKEAAIQTEFDVRVSGQVVKALDHPDAAGVIDTILTENYIDIGKRASEGMVIIKDAITGAILESAGSLDGTHAYTEAKYLKVLSDVKLVGDKTFGGTAEGKLFIEKLKAAADTQHNKARAAQDLAREREIKAMIESQENSKAEFIKKGGTAKQFWKTEEGKRQLAWATDIGAYSEDTSTRTHAKLMQNQAYLVRGKEHVNSFLAGIDVNNLTDDEILQKAVHFGGFSGEQLDEVVGNAKTQRMATQGSNPLFIEETKKYFLTKKNKSYNTTSTDPSYHDYHIRSAIWAEWYPEYQKKIAGIESGLDRKEAIDRVTKINSDFYETLTDALEAETKITYRDNLTEKEIGTRSILLGTKLRDVIGVSNYFNGQDYLGALALKADYIRKGTYDDPAAKKLVREKLENSRLYKLINELELPAALVIDEMRKYTKDPKGWSEKGVIENPIALAKVKRKEGNVFTGKETGGQ